MDNIDLLLFIVGLMIVLYGLYMIYGGGGGGGGNVKFNESYMEVLKAHEKERIFPYRYFKDETGKMIPMVAVTAFFRDDRARDLFDEYLENGVQIIGITSYKSFPKAVWDGTADETTANYDFDYVDRIQNWLSCFKNPHEYGFSINNRLINISESDFYDADEKDSPNLKKYDFLYVCFDDSKTDCPKDGWNAVNRNFDLAQKCFPVMIHEFQMRICVIGRTKCGLKEKYGDKIEVHEFLPYHEFQQKMRECRYLFIPNIADASPRTVAEAMIKNIPVLMNRKIMCGSKYITEETGELFTDETDIAPAIRKLRDSKKNPRMWWKENYSVKRSARLFRDFVVECFPGGSFDDIQEIHFYL